MEMDFTALVVVVISVFVVNVDGIMWKLQPNVQKCLKEELQSNVLVTGDYEVQDAPGQKVDYVVCTVKIYIINHNDFFFFYRSHKNAPGYLAGVLAEI
jgi:hypothetical protein